MNSKLLYLILLCVSLIVPGTNGQAEAGGAPADESGTLVMVARTSTAVIVGVDSRVTTNGSLFSADVNRKLIDVGKSGSCAMDGYLGHKSSNLSVADSLREWVRSHPTLDVSQAIGELLNVAGGVWDKQRPEWLGSLGPPGDRKSGYPITTLLCGDIIEGHPAIIRGETFVRDDFSAGQRMLETGWGDILYVDGEIDNDQFQNAVFYPVPCPQSANSNSVCPDGNDLVCKLSKDIRTDREFLGAFDAWKFASMDQENSKGYVPSSLGLSNIQELFKKNFKSIEEHDQCVGPPNVVRIVTTCGRIQSEVEGHWAQCPEVKPISKPKPAKTVR